MTQKGPVTFPACAWYQLFVIWHMMANIVHISVPTHIAACFCISLWCLRLSISVLRWKSIRMCGRLLAPLKWNRSYYTGNSLSALHSSQQFHDDTVSTHETNGTTSSGSAFGPQLPHGPIRSLFLRGPTRNVTGEANANFARRGRHAALIS